MFCCIAFIVTFCWWIKWLLHMQYRQIFIWIEARVHPLLALVLWKVMYGLLPVLPILSLSLPPYIHLFRLALYFLYSWEGNSEIFLISPSLCMVCTVSPQGQAAPRPPLDLAGKQLLLRIFCSSAAVVHCSFSGVGKQKCAFLPL